MINPKALELVLDAEGFDQPGKWPGGDSGITIGIGYDLGYESSFVDDWKSLLSDDEISRLSEAVGKKGQSAKDIAHKFTDIEITEDQAKTVFINKTLPKYEAQTRKAFPGSDGLPELAFGALVSLVFNRGPGMDGERRAEMRKIREAVPKRDLTEIARQIRSMKRLWVGKSLAGLITRREKEAALVEEARDSQPA